MVAVGDTVLRRETMRPSDRKVALKAGFSHRERATAVRGRGFHATFSTDPRYKRYAEMLRDPKNRMPFYLQGTVIEMSNDGTRARVAWCHELGVRYRTWKLVRDLRKLV